MNVNKLYDAGEVKSGEPEEQGTTETQNIVSENIESTIIDFDEEIYARIASELLVRIEHEHFFSGTINVPYDTYCASLTSTLIIYYKTESLPEGQATVIEDIVPVWWEMHTTLDDGEELMNDFSFSTLRRFLLE